MNRRHFLLVSASWITAGPSCRSRTADQFPFDGAILGPSHEVGHLLRTPHFPAPVSQERVAVAIVGGGISGLSAGWKLAKCGVRDFALLELENDVGGNSRFGVNEITPYPWGAHYLPLPTQESRAVKELLEELGVIKGYTASGEPQYAEEYVCFAPQERLFLHGRWQEGLLPSVGISAKDRDQYDRFGDLIREFRIRRDLQGRKAFAIPMDLSARSKDLLALDRISMKEFLAQNRLDSEALHWYVNYACRDDFGCEYGDVSAWAGIHYFASRDAKGEELDGTTVLTWPEGNGWIVRRLQKKLEGRIRAGALTFSVRPGKPSIVDYYDLREKVSKRLMTDHVILACPRFLAPYLIEPVDGEPKTASRGFQYAPWLVANLTLRDLPQQRSGTPLAWDNVIYKGPSLGYVVATHQSLRTHEDGTVLTYYYPLTGAPQEERSRLLHTEWKEWARFILQDLQRPHPEIARLVRRVDIFRWGHAMVRPTPGFLWGPDRTHGIQPYQGLLFAHSDLSGFSIFEEAQYRGVAAAEEVLRRLRVPFSSSI
ncbi:MAG: NAD(P)-binding protein [Acidobacteriota bacterium]